MVSSPEPKKEVLLSKYELGRLLGRGTFAKVYHGRSLSDGSGVAIKVMDKPEVVSSGMAPRLLREVEAMRRLSHPNILRLHEVMATRSKVYLVMELAPGGDLLSRVAPRGRLPEPAARRYFQQLLSALRFCHARGVAHRDLKPQNLLLDSHGALKVSDFGLSALPDQLAADGRLRTACGTPAYAAPEVLRGKPYDGPAADAWSCGVILYVLLAGSLPFDDSNLALMYRRIQRREYTFPPWFPPPAKRMVARLLDPNPESRMTLDKAAGLPWFTRSYSLDQRLSLRDVPSVPLDTRDGQFDYVKSFSTPVMNAFDIISMSSGLDLSRLFDRGERREAKFASTASVEKIVDRIKETGTKLGYKVEWKKVVAGAEGELKSVMVMEVSIVASQLLLVELRIEGGGADDDQGFCWGSLKTELEDIVFAWHNNGDVNL